MEGLIFHRTGIIGCKSRNKVLLIISTVQCRNKNVIISLDPGANISLLLHDAASRSGLKGSLISLSITKVGSTNEHISSKEYTLPLVNFEGKPWYIHLTEGKSLNLNWFRLLRYSPKQNQSSWFTTTDEKSTWLLFGRKSSKSCLATKCQPCGCEDPSHQ